ncbi:FAD-dependent monooxygenase [Actinoallomurus acaciae]|uniref:FAD-dependent monooxygenase n=1 Tax=Actinoallomurus acaciae TaxID=502577 RepID=A0ABV5YG90_9ACTN
MWDVVVVGGGPVGLLLAAEVRGAGASVVVLEQGDGKEPAPDEDGDRGLQAGTLRMLAERGLLEEVLRRAEATDGPAIADFDGDPGDGAPADIAELVRSWGSRRLKGHFAMLPLLDRDGTLDDVPVQREVWQGRLVAVLADHARRLGVEIRHHCEVVEVRDTGTEVHASLADGSRVTGRWGAGCDGARGVVGRAPGFAFDDVDPAMVVLMGEPTLEGPALLTPGVHRTPGGIMFVNPPPGELVVAEFGRPAEAWRGPVTTEEFTAALRRVSGSPDVRVADLRRAVRVTDHTRLARDYRSGRLLLAGDAAHLHSPMGGQGLNLGLHDAMDLGTPLAAVATGRSAEPVLNGYTERRHPIAARVLRDTRAQSALLRTDRHSADLREVMAELIELPEVKRHLAGLVAGTIR